ncbi:hypothetical protein GCM10027590_24080 [Nocardiopsis nanhaiensis]
MFRAHGVVVHGLAAQAGPEIGEEGTDLVPVHRRLPPEGGRTDPCPTARSGPVADTLSTQGRERAGVADLLVVP